MNIIKDACQWLNNCNGDWQSAEHEFQEYLKGNQISVEESIGHHCDFDKLVTSAVDRIVELYNSYLKGDTHTADTVSSSLLADCSVIQIPSNFAFFRGRANESGYCYTKEEMFHVPFEKRHLVGNQRFSISGIPCLYLGGSPYICWEELGRPDYQKCNFSIFKNRENISIYDFCLPQEIKTEKDIIRTVIIIACSIPANSTHVFKSQYILPQCLLQAIVSQRRDSQGLDYGIRYYSTHFLCNKSSLFIEDLDDHKKMERHINYVFPSLSEAQSGLSEILLSTFDFSEPISIMQESIMNPVFCVTYGVDRYTNSAFGAVDNELRKKIGLNPIMRDAVMYVEGKGGAKPIA